MSDTVRLTEEFRGGLLDLTHYGYISIVDEKGKVIYCWIALNSGCELKLSPLIKSPKYTSLIRDMLQKDPELRPSASDVLKRLREAEPVIEEPWPEHSIVLDRDKLEAADIAGLKKVTADGEKAYELIYFDGTKKPVTKDELYAMGLLKITAPKGFCTPWDEHGLVFDIDKIKSRGFISCEQKIMAGIKGYQFYRSDSNSMFFKPETLLAMKYANKSDGSPAPAAEKAPAPAPTMTEVRAPEPAPAESTPAPAASAFAEAWDEHGIAFDADGIRAKGFVRSERAELGGVKGYNFYTADGACRFIRAEMAVIQKLAKKV